MPFVFEDETPRQTIKKSRFVFEDEETSETPVSATPTPTLKDTIRQISDSERQIGRISHDKPVMQTDMPLRPPRPLHPVEKGPYNVPAPPKPVPEKPKPLLPMTPWEALYKTVFPTPVTTRDEGMTTGDIAAIEKTKTGKLPMEGIEPNPWVDPSTVAPTAGVMAGRLAYKAGTPIVKALPEILKYAAGSAVMDYPIGQVTEKVAGKYPSLALPFNLALGTVAPPSLKGIQRLVNPATKIATTAPDVTRTPEMGDLPTFTKNVPPRPEMPPRPLNDRIRNNKLVVGGKILNETPKAVTLTSTVNQKPIMKPSPTNELNRILNKPAWSHTAEDRAFINQYGGLPSALPSKPKNLPELMQPKPAPVKPPELQAELSKPSLQPNEKINAITREEAGRLIAKGDHEVIHHIEEGVASKGKLTMQDAINNQEMIEVAKAKKGAEREGVRQHIQELQPEIDAALKGKVAPPAPKVEPKVKESWEMTRENIMQLGDINENTPVRTVGYRYGDMPASGYSYNNMENKYEKGVSMASAGGLPEVRSFAVTDYASKRPKKYYRGDVIGTGGDDEYIMVNLEPITYNKYKHEIGGLPALQLMSSKYRTAKILANKGFTGYSEELIKRGKSLEVLHKKLIKQALSEGKPVPPEVLKDYPDLVPKATRTEPAKINESEPGSVPVGGLPFNAKLPKYAKSVNLDRIGADYDVKRLILDTSIQYSQKMKEARQGTISLSETRQRASELLDRIGKSDMTTDDLIGNIKAKTDDLDAWMNAGRDVLNTSAARVEELRKLAFTNRTDEAMARFKMALNTHAEIQAEVGGGSGKIGRALGAHRLMSQPVKNWKAILKAAGGRELTDDILDRLSTMDMTDMATVSKFIRDVAPATTLDKIYEVWVNSLLSGPVTHVVNATSNILTFLSKLPEETGASSLDLLRATLTGTPRERFFGESLQHTYGTWQGIKDGVRIGLKAYQTEMPMMGVSKLETRPFAIKGKIGKAVRIPGRLLMAADEFFKAVNYSAELHSLAYRKATSEGKGGADKARRITELITNPDLAMKTEAEQEMLYRVFQKELGPVGKWVMKGRSITPGMRYIIPFVRTPLNIAKFGLERTPLYLPFILRKALKGDLKGGQVSDELGKVMVGSMIGAATLMYAREGAVTGGGPRDKEQREALYRTGWQPYSIKVGDTYLQYGRLEPLGMIVGLSADASEIWDQMNEKEQESIAALLTTAIAKNLLNKTFVKGLSDAFDAFSDPARYGEKWIHSLGGTIVPNLAATTARAIDPEIKDIQTMLDAVKARIPVVSKSVPGKRGLWGEKIERPGMALERMISPIQRSTAKGGKIDTEMVRMGLGIGVPRKTLTISGKEIELSPELYDWYAKNAGSVSNKILSRVVSSSKWDRLPDEMKEKVIRDVIFDVRMGAKEKMYPQLRSMLNP